MLAPSMVKEIRRLLVEGNFSQRKIARLTGVSRGTIGAIACGKRPDYEPRSRVEDEFEQLADRARKTNGNNRHPIRRQCAVLSGE